MRRLRRWLCRDVGLAMTVACSLQKYHDVAEMDLWTDEDLGRLLAIVRAS